MIELIPHTRSAERATVTDLVALSQMRPRKRRIRKMTTIVTIIPIIPVGPRISCRSFLRESQRTAAARCRASPSWSIVATQHSIPTRRDSLSGNGMTLSIALKAQKWSCDMVPSCEPCPMRRTDLRDSRRAGSSCLPGSFIARFIGSVEAAWASGHPRRTDGGRCA